MSVMFVGYGLNVLQRFRIGRVRRAAPERLDYNQCLCLPLTPLPGPKLSLRGGIFLDGGGYLAASGLVTNGHVVVGAGEGPLPTPRKSLAGRSLYLGICHYHYGHFLVETLSRLWCFNRDELAGFDHIVLLPLDGHVPDFVYDLFRLLGVAEKIRVVSKPLQLESVCIPAPAIVYPRNVHSQVAAIPTLFEDCRAEQETDQPLFISRTAVTPGHHRTLIGEAWVERVLAAQGVRIFHPQRHSVIEQIAALNQHRTLIGFAGSALHTLLLAGGKRRVFAYSARPVPPVFPLLDQALGNEATYIQAQRAALPGLAHIATGFSPQLIDPRPILATLRKAGVIGRYDLGDYGSPAEDAAEACRYNTALLLRRVLEASQDEGDAACHEEIQAFKKKHALDPVILAHAREESALLRKFFPA